MSTKQIVVTQYDLDRLRRLVNEAVAMGSRDELAGLIGELDRAIVVAPHEIPSDVVTMNSHVRLVDVETGDAMEISLVFPDDAISAAGAVSILAPVGTAIIGYGQGDSVEWPTPSGLRTFRIDQVIFQPEAAGEWDL
ncbi:MAG: nucleoside diphosphate kinase regulator [Coriobacteriia bacterium]|nr:nucleoside diphosphate kinase regulator [Coriobacteriia bacterium]